MCEVLAIRKSHTTHLILFQVNHTASVSSGVEFLGSVEASVVGLSHFFHNAADSNGAQIKKLASFLGKSCVNAYGMLEIVLRRNTNVPADVNAVSILVPNIEESSEGGTCYASKPLISPLPHIEYISLCFCGCTDWILFKHFLGLD